VPDAQQPDLAQTIFGGLVTELNPADLPAGSSPLCCDCDFTIGSVKTRYGESPLYASIGNLNFNWIKTFQMTDGDVLNLLLDSSGTLWQEDLTNSPGTLAQIYTFIEPNVFAKSVTEDDREFIAFSDLQMGADMPRYWDGTSLNRVSQVGPGAGCQVSAISTSYTITSISQIGAKTLGDGTASYYVLWSAGPTLREAGNIITFYGPIGTTWAGAGPTGQLQQGDQVVIANVQTMNGFNPNNGGSNPVAYVVTSVGTAQGASGIYPVFTILVNEIGFYDNQTANTATYSPTLATLVTSVPVPNMQVGSQLTISGASPATWDGTFTVLQTPNGAQLAITSTSLASNLATYAYTLVSGVAPTAGEQVTVAGTSNGNGIFNVTNAIIASTGVGTFSVTIISPNISSAAESGNGIVNATTFQFDPGQVIATSATGSLVVAGNLGAGTRGCVVMFLTDSDYLTEPSPQTIFTLSASASSIVASQIPTGPSNIKARVLAFTGGGGATLAGGGGFYYWIPQPVSVISNNQVVIYSATIINDNTTTQATLTFTDNVLLEADSISFQGENQFELIELGNCLGFITYANRLFAWGEQNKIQNLLNPSFDGGIASVIPPPGNTGTTTQTYPLGWTSDPVYGAYGSVVPSPLFGNAYQISQPLSAPVGFVNTSGTTVTWVSGSVFPTVWNGAPLSIEVPQFGFTYTIQTLVSTTSLTTVQTLPTHTNFSYNFVGVPVGMITQSAYQDSFGEPIIETDTTYSVRVTAGVTAGTIGGLVVDLYSPSLGRQFGKFTFQTASMTTNMQVYSGTLLTSPFAIVPSDLLLRVYAGGPGSIFAFFTGTVTIDRIEVFPTEQPVLSTQLRASYQNNFEAFDDVTGNLGVGVQNQQPVTTAFCLFDNLYVVRDHSFCSTSDNGITEPNLWDIKEIAGIGTPSINGVDYSGDNDKESWALIAGQSGLYVFDGAQPEKISPEIDTLWQTINWAYGYTLWVRNDTINRRICVGVPIPTPNKWMPQFPANSNPTTPNVILMCSYRELMTSAAVKAEGSVRQSFMGELRTFQLGRKWSAWSIPASYADFVQRADTTQPLTFCDNRLRGKVYVQLTGNYLDDGAAIPWDYIGSPMPKTIEAQQLGMGNLMLEATFLTALIQGSGQCNLTCYPDTITSPYADSLGAVTMGDPPAWGDTEIILNEMGARFFTEFSSGSAGSNFELSRIVMSIQRHPWSAVRGVNA
jgi:hypothetical protein